jgi:hypothetical protein
MTVRELKEALANCRDGDEVKISIYTSDNLVHDVRFVEITDDLAPNVTYLGFVIPTRLV